MKRPFHPLLIALFPLLSLYSANVALIPPSQLARPVAWLVGGTLAVWLVLALALRNVSRAAIVVSLLVVATFSFGHVLNLIMRGPKGAMGAHIDLLWAWVPTWLIVLVVAGWKRKSYDAGTQLLNLIALVLVFFPAITIAGELLSSNRSGATSAHVASGTRPAERPDIFYIVLDGYGRSDVLRRKIGFDNSAFVEALRRRGFVVADGAVANYLQTQQSLASALNMDYLQRLFPNLEREGREVLDHAVDENAVASRLRKAGYTYAAIRTGFPYFNFTSADLVLGGSGGEALLESALLSMTPLVRPPDVGRDQHESRREMVHAAFENLAELAKPATRPKFVIAHVLAPHPPFVFGPNGEPRRPARFYSLVDGSHFMQHGGTPEEYRDGYRDQAMYLNKLVLRCVDRILEHARTPPVIILQGDHGSKMGLDHDALDRTDVAEVAPILMAVHVRPEMRDSIPADLAPVNLFRVLLSGLFGDDLPALPNRTYYSTWQAPGTFADVTDRVSISDAERQGSRPRG